MAIVIDHQSLTKVVGSQAGYLRVRGVAHWNGTDATANLPCLFGHIVSIDVDNKLLACNTDETIYVDTSVSGTLVNGVIVVPSTGLLPIARTGTATSGLPFSFEYSGF